MSLRSVVSLLVLGGIHLFFLVGLMLDESLSFELNLVRLSCLIFVVLGYARFSNPVGTYTKIETLLTPFVITVAGICTYSISIDLALGPVIAAAGIAFIGSYIPNLFKSPTAAALPAPIYCGSFVGMCGTYLTEDYFFIAHAGLSAGIVYLLTRDAFNGMGGKLGTIAFGGISVVAFIYEAL